MRTIYLNAGTMVHFAEPNSDDEKQSYSSGKAIVVDEKVITNISDSQEIIREYTLPRRHQSIPTR